MSTKTKVTGMETKAITIHVSPEAASAYETAPAEQQRKLDALLSLKLAEVTRAKRPLEVIMSEMSRKAQERGLTPEILESILNEQ
jgi:nickel-dependent lactate racemase